MTQNYVVTKQNFVSHYTGTLFDLTNVASLFFLACLTNKKTKAFKHEINAFVRCGKCLQAKQKHLHHILAIIMTNRNLPANAIH